MFSFCNDRQSCSEKYKVYHLKLKFVQWMYLWTSATRFINFKIFNILVKLVIFIFIVENQAAFGRPPTAVIISHLEYEDPINMIAKLTANFGRVVSESEEILLDEDGPEILVGIGSGNYKVDVQISTRPSSILAFGGKQITLSFIRMKKNCFRCCGLGHTVRAWKKNKSGSRVHWWNNWSKPGSQLRLRWCFSSSSWNSTSWWIQKGSHQESDKTNCREDFQSLKTKTDYI